MIEFVVRVPEDTPPDPTLYLTGDALPLGRWQADAVRLDRWGDGTHRARVALPHGAHAHYLVTRGRWRDVEGSGRGREIPSRVITADRHLVVDVNVAGWGRAGVRYHPEFGSRFLCHPRPVAVALPPGYDLRPDRRYPVFYLHDGQNLFDAATAFAGVAWQCDETADRLARAGEIAPVILVGVGNTPDRLAEYGPVRTGRRPRGPDPARAYGRFLVEELKPYVDATYRTLTGPGDTAVGGSSMGGLISLHLCRWHPEVFGGCAAVSPSLWWDREYYLRSVRDWPLRGCKIWLDMGGREGNSTHAMSANVRRARRLAAAFRELGFEEGRGFRYAEFPDAGHNESAWGERFDQVLRFLFVRG
jgi:predicted alpha/beta superfamily hydrolase